MVTRVAAWWRWLRLWFVDQRKLRAQVADLEQEVMDVRADYEKELLVVEELRDQGMAMLRATIADLDRECEGWKRLAGDAEAQVKTERRLGNKAWQEVSRVKREAGRLGVAVDAS